MDSTKINPVGTAVERAKDAKGWSLAVFGVFIASILAAGLLWLRFGDGVFAASVVSGFIACF